MPRFRPRLSQIESIQAWAILVLLFVPLLSLAGLLVVVTNGWALLLLLPLLSYSSLSSLSQRVDPPPGFKVCIIGSGVSGLCMAKRLTDIGVPFTILEKYPALGGTWWENRYPGIACDVPSHFYSFSFFRNSHWSRAFSEGGEILKYLEQFACHFRIYPHIQFNKKVVKVHWQEKESRYTVECEDGSSLTANVVVNGTGGLNIPKIPNFKDMDKFQGKAMHTAQWDPEYDPRGKRVAVIGTGASAVQVVPAVAEQTVQKLFVFQRTPCWSVPRMDFRFPPSLQTLFEWVPPLAILYRWHLFIIADILRFPVIFTMSDRVPGFLKGVHNRSRDLVHKAMSAHIRRKVKDPSVAAKLVPSYPMGCKRITPSDTYLQAFNKEQVCLVTDPIDRFTEDGILTTSGVEHKVDTIIYATGFDILAAAAPYEIQGVQGIDIGQKFGDNPQGYLGITNEYLPNAFFLLGPGTGLGHGSAIYMIECQVEYAIQGIIELINRKAASIRVKEQVDKEYQEWVQKDMKGRVFEDNTRCVSWYRNSKGINYTLWPSSMIKYWQYTRAFDISCYHVQY